MFRRSKSGAPQQPGVTRRVLRLRADLAEASNIQPLSTDPLLNVVLLERMRVVLSRCMWWFLSLGLGFTTAGVHDFLVTGRTVDDPVWWGGWLVEPAFAGILITLLRWESEMLARGVEISQGAPIWLKRVLLGSTLVMNVVPTMWHPGTRRPTSPGDVFVHIVIPIVVFLVAEVMPVIQSTFTEAIDRAGRKVPAAPDVTPTAALAQRHLDAMPVPLTNRHPVQSPVVLPASMRAKLDAARARLGRDLTVDDIRSTVQVSAAYAEQLATALAARPATNGHPVI